MEYSDAFKEYVEKLKHFLLGQINYNDLQKASEDKKESYSIVFETEDWDEFSKKMYEFFPDKELVKKKLEHEIKHFNINKNFDLKSKMMLKSYERDGKTRYRPSIEDIDLENIKENWSKQKFWEYYFENTSMDDASDNDKYINKMLLEIKEQIIK
jgi:hypothetical protein